MNFSGKAKTLLFVAFCVSIFPVEVNKLKDVCLSHLKFSYVVAFSVCRNGSQDRSMPRSLRCRRFSASSYVSFPQQLSHLYQSMRINSPLSSHFIVRGTVSKAPTFIHNLFCISYVICFLLVTCRPDEFMKCEPPLDLKGNSSAKDELGFGCLKVTFQLFIL